MRRPFLLYDGRVGKLAQVLAPYGIPVALPPYERLPLPVCAHPDLLVFYHDGVLYTYSEYYNCHKDLFDALSVAVKPLDLKAGNYPDDIWFDHLQVGNYLFGKKERLPKEFEDLFTFVNVKQGYARCSAVSLKGKMVITADKGITSAAEKSGVEVLQVVPGHILLPGYSCGFIGGACGVVDDTVLFFGSFQTHPDAEKVSAFLCERGFRTVNLFDGWLHDFGGMVCIPVISNGMIHNVNGIV